MLTSRNKISHWLTKFNYDNILCSHSPHDMSIYVWYRRPSSFTIRNLYLVSHWVNKLYCIWYHGWTSISLTMPYCLFIVLLGAFSHKLFIFLMLSRTCILKWNRRLYYIYRHPSLIRCTALMTDNSKMKFWEVQYKVSNNWTIERDLYLTRKIFTN